MRDKPIRDTLIRAAGGFGLHTVRQTRRNDLVDLMRSLRPFDSGIELIRLGPNGDGGYLVPDDLDGIKFVFSPGVSTESGFEQDLANRGLRVFLADYSVEGPAEENPQFVFEKKFVGSFPSESTMTMDDWKRRSIQDDRSDLLLQMDIEGSEFETVLSMSQELLSQFRIMIVEFHYLHQLWNKPWFRHVSRAFQKLLSTHSVVHIHPNNCCGSFASHGLRIPRVAEFTFLRNDRFRARSPRSQFPHPLDRDNANQPTLPLPRCWYADSYLGPG